MIDGILLLYYFICIKQKAHPTCPTMRTVFEAMNDNMNRLYIYYQYHIYTPSISNSHRHVTEF